MTAWVQRHDYSSEEETILSVEEAVEILRRFDWETEITCEEEALARSHDCCPAGLGLVSEEGQILHIIPRRDSMAMIHYHYGSGGWSRESVVTVEGFSLALVRPLMERHFAGAGSTIEVLALLEMNGTPLN